MGLREGDVDSEVVTRHGARQITLTRFRNYESLVLELDPGFNVLSGRNAQGKTNLLEALYLLATTRLLRGQKDAEAIQDGSEGARVSVELLDANTELSLTLERGVRKRASVNGMSVPRASDLIGRMPAVSVSSADLAVVRGEPSDRRLFLDIELSGLFQAYLRHLTLYKRALDQRNALLREARDRAVSETEFEVWETPLALHGAAIRQTRRSFLDDLGERAREAHIDLSAGESLSVGYLVKDEANSESALREFLMKTRALDVARGSTGIGPHRDDVLIEVGGRDARLFGSQGQQRTSVLALKLGAMAHAQSVLGSPPLLLLDDIFSDLDERRRSLLVDRVCALRGQAVLTCTEPALAGKGLLGQAKLFYVEAGKVSEA